jgi:hypothetical protein
MNGDSLLKREGRMVFEICPVLLGVAETTDNARGHNGVLDSLICLGLDVPCKESIGLNY